MSSNRKVPSTVQSAAGVHQSSVHCASRPDELVFPIRGEWTCRRLDSLRYVTGGFDLLYMIVETYKNRDPLPVYRRFRDQGRLAPEGVRYVSSWVDEKLERCFQLMEAEERELIDEWIARWSDLVDFEVYAVVSSAEAAERVASHL